MYRQQAERFEEEAQEKPKKPIERIAITRIPGLVSGLAAIFVVLGAVAAFHRGPIVASLLTFVLWSGIVFAIARLVALVFRPIVVAIDRDERLVTSRKESFSFELLSHAKMVTDRPVALVLVLKNGDEKTIAVGTYPLVDDAVAKINIALAEEYPSFAEMPVGLRACMLRLDRGFPLSGFNRLPDKARRDRIAELFRPLPLANLTIQRDATPNAVHAVGTSEGFPVEVRYKMLRDRVEICFGGASVHGHLHLLRDPTLSTRGGSLVEVAHRVFINGAKNRAKFHALPSDLQRRILSGMEDLDLRIFNITPTGIRVVPSEGLRQLLHPFARVARMIELATGVAKAIQARV